jgi:anti-sigma factor RsiW
MPHRFASTTPVRAMTTTSADRGLLLHAYLDGELDPAHALEFEQQLAGDPALAAERDRVAALRRAIAEQLPREAASPALVRRIEAAIGIGGAALLPFPAGAGGKRRGLATQPSWRALAASVALALFIGSGTTFLVLQPPPAESTADLVVAGHLRGLMAPQPIDVASSDRHTVKPWFNGRIPQAPRVVDLASEGFALVGGRIDVIGRVPVPTLVYRVRAHLISLSEIPAGTSGSPLIAPRAIAGYNIVTWTDGGVAYWAVSDLGGSDLEAFAKAFRSASAEP